LIIDVFTYVLMALAAYRLTRLLTTDVILEGLREKIWKKYPPETKIGYLFTCNWCMSIWTAAFIIGLASLLPAVAYVVSLILSISALVGLVATKLDN